MANSQEHVTCALCGMMGTIERLQRGPFPPVSRTRTWGGSIKREKGSKGKRQGIMDWSERRKCSRPDLLIMQQKLKEALAVVEEELK